MGTPVEVCQGRVFDSRIQRDVFRRRDRTPRSIPLNGEGLVENLLLPLLDRLFVESKEQEVPELRLTTRCVRKTP